MVIKAIIQQKSPVVVVIGTGVGKSILFILLTLYFTKVTVIVIPLISLRGDIKRQYKKVGIEYIK